MSIDDLLALDDYELEKKFFVGSSAVTDNRFEFLKESLDQLKQEWAMRRCYFNFDCSEQCLQLW